MKEIVIVLTLKEAFAITHSGIGKVGRRKAFGTPGLTKRIHDQIKAQSTAQEYDDIKAEWLTLAPKFPDDPNTK